MRYLRQAECRVQRAVQFRHVVGVGGLPEDVQDGRFMRMGFADFRPDAGFGGGRLQRRHRIAAVHGAGSGRTTANASSPTESSGASGRVSSQNRRTRFCATFMR